MEQETQTIVDSGERREFESGAVRDITSGKGRCDLLPLFAAGLLFEAEQNTLVSYALRSIDAYVRQGDVLDLARGTNVFIGMLKGETNDTLFDNMMINISDFLLDVSIHYEDGCKKYGERNWEKGIPLHSYIDSGVRHLLKYMRGDTDERHDRAFVWNMLGAIHTHIYHPELIDLPCKAVLDAQAAAVQQELAEQADQVNEVQIPETESK